MSERVRKYRDATLALDAAALAEMRHPEFECFYPQSGERFVGHDAWAAAHKDYESRFSRERTVAVTTKGGEQRAKVTTAPSVMPFASTPIIQVSDAGDLVVVEGRGQWPDGKVYNWVLILEYRDGLVWRETEYFAEPFEPPEWREPFTTPVDDGAGR